MIQEDWIERQIRKFAEATARALGFGDRGAGHDLLEETAVSNLGIGLRVAMTLSADQLLAMLAPGRDRQQRERVAQLAGLLLADADVDHGPDDDPRRRKAAALLAGL